LVQRFDNTLRLLRRLASGYPDEDYLKLKIVGVFLL